ncbi:hypothetical protein GBA52_003273 [Prunus armeniaca]|nr:hypothetical protein GBA52_003273 [Prunus armeniaca]
MKTSTQPKLLTFKYVFLSLLLALPILLLVLRLQPQNLRWTAAAPGDIRLPTVPNITTRGIRIRPGYTSYEAYIERQAATSLDHPRLGPEDQSLLPILSAPKAPEPPLQRLQIPLHRRTSRPGGRGAAPSRRVDSVGIDLVPYPPLVVKGDFHNQPFGNDTFDFEFSNVFDHALLPDKFVAEIERTLKPRGVCVLHVAVARRTDKYSANDLFSIKPLVEMFRRSELVQVREIDGFGANTEAVFMKRETGYGEHIQRS